jgi:hypothetical protein
VVPQLQAALALVVVVVAAARLVTAALVVLEGSLLEVVVALEILNLALEAVLVVLAAQVM